MRLEDVTVALRPRGPWEAVDLGCTLVRRDYGRILALWAATAVPVWLVLAALMWRQPAWYSFLVWWLKPLYDRVPLYFLSHATFGVKPGFLETWKQWPRLWSRFLLSALILHRLSPIRSFALPVLMLEGQKGRLARQRVRALGTDGRSTGFKVTYAFLKLEIAVWLGLLVLTRQLAPESGLPNFEDFLLSGGTDLLFSNAFYWYLNILYLVAMTIIEPFYVGAGFGLYLNCRTRLEGWDIELSFRRLAARLRSAAMVATMIAVCLTPCSFANAIPAEVVIPNVRREKVAAPVVGSDKTPTSEAKPSPPSAAASEKLKQIVAQPEFVVHSRTHSILVPTIQVPDWTAIVVRILFWLFVAAVVAAVVYWCIRNRHLFFIQRPIAAAQRTIKSATPRVVMGLNVAGDTLPDDIPRAAREAWLKGDCRLALSLLYRGALSRLIEQRRIPIRSSDTEDDCLRHVVRSGDRSITDYFRRLTQLWVQMAYGGLEVADDAFSWACSAWPFDRVPPANSQNGRSRRGTTAVLLLLPIFLLAGCRVKEVTREIGYKGKARTDPFLAARLLLQSYGHDTSRKASLDHLPESKNGVLMLSAENEVSTGRTQRLLKWVRAGGHLIYPMAGCLPYNDWGLFAHIVSSGSFDEDRPADAVLEALDVTTNDGRPKEAEKRATNAKDSKKSGKHPGAKPAAPKGAKKKPFEGKPGDADTEQHDIPTMPTVKTKLIWDGVSYTINVPAEGAFKMARPLRVGEFAAGDHRQSTAILSVKCGEGRVTLMNHARPFRSRYLSEHDHAALLVALVGKESHEVQFIVGLDNSFIGMLWQHGWKALTGLALMTAIWLWCHIPRFGPKRQPELHETKHFVDHVGALGQFFHRLRRNDILLNAAANTVRSRALLRYPHLRDASDADLIPLLAEKSGLTTERVQAALAAEGSGHTHQLIRHLQDLQTLRQAL